jgi:hypothetical protein
VQGRRDALRQCIEHALLLLCVRATIGTGADGDRPARHPVVVEQPHPAAVAEHGAGGLTDADAHRVADALDEHGRMGGIEQGHRVLSQLPRRGLSGASASQCHLRLAEPVHLVHLQAAVGSNPTRDEHRRDRRHSDEREQSRLDERQRERQDHVPGRGQQQERAQSPILGSLSSPVHSSVPFSCAF